MREYPLEFVEDLERTGCDVLGCDHTSHDGEIFFHSRCHPNAPTWSSYRAGVLTVSCAVCWDIVSAIAVARRPVAASAP